MWQLHFGWDTHTQGVSVEFQIAMIIEGTILHGHGLWADFEY